MKYQILYKEEVINQHIPRLNSSPKKLIARAIEERLTLDPITFGKPLRYGLGLKGYRSLRISVYRIIYRIEIETSVVIITAIGPRKDVYKT